MSRLLSGMRLYVGTNLGDFSVQPRCSLCLCGCYNSNFYNHRDTENTEVAQRTPFVFSDAAFD